MTGVGVVCVCVCVGGGGGYLTTTQPHSLEEIPHHYGCLNTSKGAQIKSSRISLWWLVVFNPISTGAGGGGGGMMITAVTSSISTSLDLKRTLSDVL